MLVNTRRVRIEWGDCDPAGIIFYPRYFEFFDASTSALIERALGANIQIARFPVRRLADTWGLVARAAGGTKGSALEYVASHHGCTPDCCQRNAGRLRYRIQHDSFKRTLPQLAAQ